MAGIVAKHRLQMKFCNSHLTRNILIVVCGVSFLALFIRAELSIYVRGHRKDTSSRYVIETLFHYSRQVREVIYI